ncbi:MAG: flagellar motor protein MotB [Candidatus Polarisedimenticolaceae bacterium]|nr:flagellar motor protein MotB [Candidatus Polarisedimenticolaceae bacterium]
MAEEAEEHVCECEEGLPAWMATFADMMALLMCFFVLLLSFAEMDAIRFKKMAESMKDAFGVQKEIPINEIVRGISVVALEFSPSISDPAITETVRQETTEEEKERLEVNDGPEKAGEANADAMSMDAAEERLKAEAEDQAEELKKSLKKEIDEGMVTIEVVGANVIIRINEKGSFPSGSADLRPEFIDVLERITVAISTRPGKVVVAGHTDNVPISTERFRSNWELSTARAVTVAHAILADPTLDPKRFLLEGHADSDPLVPNDTPENRGLNRRVELIIKRVKEDVQEGSAAAKSVEPVINPIIDPDIGLPQPGILDSATQEPPFAVESEDIIAPVTEMNPDDAVPAIVPEDDLRQDETIISVEDLI